MTPASAASPAAGAAPGPIRRPRAVSALVVATIALGLWIDRAAGVPGQIAVSVAVWIVTSALCLWLPPEIGRRLVACVWISGLGEMVASLAWGLYDYQFGNVPLFVPPGHALLYLLGLIIAARVDTRFVALVVAGSTPLVILLACSGQDWLSPPLYAVFLLFVTFGRQKKLYATMFVIALAMEIYGTALGNWAWRATVPGTGLPTLNPPLAAGVFYCALDWLVNRYSGMRKPASGAAQ